MGVIRNIKASIDDKSSMSVNSITLLASALMGVIVGLVMCFVLVYDVVYDGKVLGSGAPKAYVDSRMKTRSWVENEKLQIEAEEDVEDYRAERRRKRRNKDQIIDVEGDTDDGSEDNLDNE